MPPRVKMDVPTKVVFRKLPIESIARDTGWVTECNTLPGGVRVSRTLIPDNRFQDIPVRIRNVSSQPVTIRAGANVANLQKSWQIIGRMPTEQSTETRIPGETKPSAEVPEFVQDLVNKVNATADDDVR